MVGEEKKGSSSVRVYDKEEIVAMKEEDNDAGYIDPISLREEGKNDHNIPTNTCIDPGHNSTNGHTLPSIGMNGHSGKHRYIQHHGSRCRKYTRNVIEWMDKKMNCVVNWTISILAIVSMILKLPFFIFLVTVLLDLIKQRLKAKAASAKNDGNVDNINKPYEEESNPTPSTAAQSTKGLLIEALIFILLLVALILLQFLVFITHAFSASKCCKNGCCCDGDDHGCGHEYHQKARRERIRKLILSVYFVPLTLWILVFISSYYLNEWPYFGGGILMMFKLLIHGNSLTGTPDMYEVTLMKYYSFISDLISFIALIAYFLLQIIVCFKHGSRYHHTCALEDACDSSKELTGRQSSSSKCSSPDSHGNKREVRVSPNRRHNYPKASTMKWYTINCGCFTLFDPRKKSSVMSMRNSSPMHEKIAPCSDSSRGTPSDCCCSTSSEGGGDICDDGMVTRSGGAYIHAGQIVDHEIDGHQVAETSLLVRNAPPSAPPSGDNREEEGRLLQ